MQTRNILKKEEIYGLESITPNTSKKKKKKKKKRPSPKLKNLKESRIMYIAITLAIDTILQ